MKKILMALLMIFVSTNMVLGGEPEQEERRKLREKEFPDKFYKVPYAWNRDFLTLLVLGLVREEAEYSLKSIDDDCYKRNIDKNGLMRASVELKGYFDCVINQLTASNDNKYTERQALLTQSLINIAIDYHIKHKIIRLRPLRNLEETKIAREEFMKFSESFCKDNAYTKHAQGIKFSLIDKIGKKISNEQLCDFVIHDNGMPDFVCETQIDYKGDKCSVKCKNVRLNYVDNMDDLRGLIIDKENCEVNILAL
ncbi:MAG: hypothetical protein MJ187_00370 [Alphaproteobacteria bacterium]|nr:hypothetical protein [Alphaproteobacteria bacterium]